jgi:hypothetical protein
VTDAFLPPFKSRAEANEAPPPPPAALIVSVEANASQSLFEIVVIFDTPVDGSTLDPDWLTDDNTAAQTDAMTDQTSLTSAVFTTPTLAGFPSLTNWTLTRSQPGLVFPQTGTVL